MESVMYKDNYQKKSMFCCVSTLMLINTLTMFCYAKTHLRNNKINILAARRSHNEVVSVEFTPRRDRYYVTKGQPSGQISAGKNFIKVEAGRKNSKEVEKKFKSWTGSSNKHIMVKVYPKKLNFAMEGTLTIQLHDKKKHTNTVGVFKNIDFAQGHSGTINKWFVGGINCTRKKPSAPLVGYSVGMPIQCKDEQKRPWCFSIATLSTSTMRVKQKACVHKILD